MDGHGGVDGVVGNAHYEAAWGCRAIAFNGGSKFGSRDDVLCLFYRFDLRNHDGGAGIESVADASVVVALDSILG